jgi:hypothetical protein
MVATMQLLAQRVEPFVGSGGSFSYVRPGPGVQPPHSRIAPDRALFALVSSSVLPLPAQTFTFYREQQPTYVAALWQGILSF